MSTRKVSQNCLAKSVLPPNLVESFSLVSSLQHRPNLDEKCTNGAQRLVEDEFSANNKTNLEKQNTNRTMCMKVEE
jgi:hypothetical protein